MWCAVVDGAPRHQPSSHTSGIQYTNTLSGKCTSGFMPVPTLLGLTVDEPGVCFPSHRRKPIRGSPRTCEHAFPPIPVHILQETVTWPASTFVLSRAKRVTTTTLPPLPSALTRIPCLPPVKHVSSFLAYQHTRKCTTNRLCTMSYCALAQPLTSSRVSPAPHLASPPCAASVTQQGSVGTLTPTSRSVQWHVSL